MVTIIGQGPVQSRRFPASRISVVVILHTLTYTYEKPSLVKLLTDCSEAMPRQQKYQNPQAAKMREKETKRERS